MFFFPCKVGISEACIHCIFKHLVNISTKMELRSVLHVSPKISMYTHKWQLNCNLTILCIIVVNLTVNEMTDR